MTEGHKKNPYIIAGVILGALVILLLFTALTYPYNDRILGGVSVDGINLAGKTTAQAEEMLQPEVNNLIDRSISLNGSGKNWSFTAGQLGLKIDCRDLAAKAWQIGRQGSIWQRGQERWLAWRQGIDLPMNSQIDQTVLAGKLAKINGELKQTAQDAAVQISADRQVIIVPGKNGQTLDVAKSKAAVQAMLSDAAKADVALTVAVVPPKVSTAQAKAWGINGVVASYTTKFNAAKIERSYNIKVAAEAIQDTLVIGGGIFSFNQTVGPRTVEAGYQEALIIENNEFVPGLAGGICQMVSTLYNGMLLAGFSVVERHPHSLPVVYVPPGLDATVAGMAIDLKMQNEFSTPVIVHTEYHKSSISVYVFGPVELKPQIRLTGRKLQTIPAGEIRVKDLTLAPGSQVVETKGIPGMVAEAVREFIKDGKVVNREILSKNRYKPLSAKIRYAPALVPVAPEQLTEELPPL